MMGQMLTVEEEDCNSKTGSETMDVLTAESSPSSVATTLDAVPSELTLSKLSVQLQSDKAKKGSFLWLVTTLFILALMWPQLTANTPVYSHPPPSPATRPLRAWTWPASVPQNGTAATSAFARVIKLLLGVSEYGTWLTSLTLSNQAAPLEMYMASSRDPVHLHVPPIDDPAASVRAQQARSTSTQAQISFDEAGRVSFDSTDEQQVAALPSHGGLRLRAGPQLITRLGDTAFGLFG